LDEGRPRRERDGRADLVRPAARAFDDLVGEAVDEIGIVAGAAGHRVRAGLAVERVVAGIAGQAVVGGIGDAGGAQQREILHIAAEHIGNAALHRVGAGAGRLRDRIRAAVDHVAVVAETAGHVVVAGATIEGVVAVAAGERVVAAEAAQLVIAGAAAQGLGAVGADEGVVAAGVGRRRGSADIDEAVVGGIEGAVDREGLDLAAIDDLPAVAGRVRQRGGRTEAVELDAVAGGAAVAGEVADDIAIGLAGLE